MTRGYMIDDIGYFIVLLSRTIGLLVAGHLETWMVHFIKTIRMGKMPIDWTTTLSDNLDKQLISIKNDPRFYMTSYIVYLIVERPTDYPGLVRKGSMQDANVQSYIICPQLVKKKLPFKSPEYRLINDGFIFSIIWFIERDYAKRMSIEAIVRIKKIGVYFIQLNTFSYIQVVGTLLCPEKIP